MIVGFVARVSCVTCIVLCGDLGDVKYGLAAIAWAILSTHYA